MYVRSVKAFRIKNIVTDMGVRREITEDIQHPEQAVDEYSDGGCTCGYDCAQNVAGNRYGKMIHGAVYSFQNRRTWLTISASVARSLLAALDPASFGQGFWSGRVTL